MSMGFYYPRVLLCFTWCFCISFLVQAQKEFLIQGILFKKGTGERLSQATVINLRNHTQIVSNDLGGFQISVVLGDSLRISKIGFATQVAAVLSEQTLVIQLQPVIVLQEVIIKGETKKQELESVMDDYRKNGSFYKGKPPVLSFLKSPLTAVYEIFGKTPSQARRFNRYIGNELQASEVDRRFTETMVSNITKLREEELRNFMAAFRPSYEQISSWNEYDLIHYIKKSLQNYKSGNMPPTPSKLY